MGMKSSHRLFVGGMPGIDKASERRRDDGFLVVVSAGPGEIRSIAVHAYTAAAR